MNVQTDVFTAVIKIECICGTFQMNMLPPLLGLKGCGDDAAGYTGR